MKIKHLILCLFLFTCINVSAQVNNRRWDLKKYNFGFLMALNFTDMNTRTRLPLYEPALKQTLYKIEIQSRVGITLGLISNIKLARNFDFRFIPCVAIQQRNYSYYMTDSISTRRLEAAYLDLPFLVRMKSNFYKNKRVYVITGFKFSANVSSNKKVRNNQNLIKTNPLDFCIELGAGVDLYGERIKLCPEIRYSLGVLNIYNPKNTYFGGAVSRLSSQMVTLSLNFE